MSDQWHLLQDGQRYGPYTGDQLLQFAQEGRIVRESLVWTEGLENWVAASAVEGLFPAVPVAVPVAPAWAPPGAPRPAWMAGGNPQGMAPRGAMAGRMAAQTMQHPVGGPYPAMETKPAGFGMVAGFVGGGVALTLLAMGILASGTIKPVEGDNSQILLLFALLGIGCACTVAGAIITYVYLARLWSYLRYGMPRTTPGKAVGLLFVPFFNLYWLFVAVYGLAQDWNRITSQYKDLQHAPKMSEGLFLAYCICSLAVAPVGLVLWFPVMAQICRSINFMAYRPVHRPGMLVFG